jgi:aryl-alcohol dehydrogenase-like predicted oxidoreductase
MSAFLSRELRAVGKRVHRLGLALSFGLDEAGVRAAFDRGLNYLYWPYRRGPLGSLLRDELARDRDRFVVATGPAIAYLGGSVRRAAEKALRALGTDHLDIFQLHWVGVAAALTDATLGELVKLKESGKARAVGISIHDRARAGRLAADSPLDVFMIRYNAAHPGAERDIFPHLAARRPSVVAYTATAWRRLLKRPAGWPADRPVMTAGDCYRFCLSSPDVDVVLCGPADRRQLDENLAAVERGPLGEDEARWMREFGRVVHDRAPAPVRAAAPV